MHSPSWPRKSLRIPTGVGSPAHYVGRILSSTGSTAPSASLTQKSAPGSSPTALLTHGTSTTHSLFALTPINCLMTRFSGCSPSTGCLRFEFRLPVQYRTCCAVVRHPHRLVPGAAMSKTNDIGVVLDRGGGREISGLRFGWPRYEYVRGAVAEPTCGSWVECIVAYR